MECGNMGLFDRGVQMLLTTVGAFAAFSLMTIAVGTDYWLYSRGVCKTKSMSENETSKKNEEVMTHSGLWRTCCLEGEGVCVCGRVRVRVRAFSIHDYNQVHKISEVKVSDVAVQRIQKMSD